MSKGRIEAFSDGVLAILITIMVLELRAPHETNIASLKPLVPVFLTYVLSYVYLGIYWNNHHHMLHAAERINGATLWANLHLLFWLSLVPFATDWMGENHFAAVPTSAYGVVLLGAAVAYLILQNTLIAAQGAHSRLGDALRLDVKGKISPLMYVAGILLAFVYVQVSEALYVAGAMMWLVPDRRLEPKPDRENTRSSL
jgi:uncharacterized membrane protein